MYRSDSSESAGDERMLRGLSEEEELVAVYLRDEIEEVELQQKLDEEPGYLGLAYIDTRDISYMQIEEVRTLHLWLLSI